MRRVLGLAVAVVGLCSANLEAAVLLDDPTIAGSSPAFPGYGANFLLDENLNTDYASNGAGTGTFVDFDFGVSTLITEVLYTDRRTSGGFNGTFVGGNFDNVTAFDLVFSNDLVFGNAGDFTVSVSSPGFANTDPIILINSGLGVLAQYVRFDVTATSGASGVNVGGAEIDFYTAAAVPEPGTLALAGMGVIGFVGGAIRKRRKAAAA